MQMHRKGKWSNIGVKYLFRPVSLQKWRESAPRRDAVLTFSIKACAEVCRCAVEMSLLDVCYWLPIKQPYNQQHPHCQQSPPAKKKKKKPYPNRLHAVPALYHHKSTEEQHIRYGTWPTAQLRWQHAVTLQCAAISQAVCVCMCVHLSLQEPAFLSVSWGGWGSEQFLVKTTPELN